MLPFLRELPSGFPEIRLHLQAFFRNRAARRKIPGLNRGASSTIAQTHYAIVKKKGTGVRVRGNPCRVCVTEMTE